MGIRLRRRLVGERSCRSSVVAARVGDARRIWGHREAAIPCERSRKAAALSKPREEPVLRRSPGYQGRLIDYPLSACLTIRLIDHLPA